MYLVKKNIVYSYINKNSKAIILLVASLVSMVIMLGINFFLTKLLDKESFGNYAFIINIFLFAGIIFNFGYFHSIGRMMALTKSDIYTRELYFLGLLMALVLSIAMILCLYLYVILNVNNLSNEVLDIFYIFIPLSLFFLLNSFNESTFQGSNRILLLAFSRVSQKTIFIILLFGTYYFHENNVSLRFIFVLYFLGFLISSLCIVNRLRIKSTNVKRNIAEVNKVNREFGFNVYLGSVVAVGASSLSGILISYFGTNNVEVGYYTIAQQFAAILPLIPNILATVYFKRFAAAESIDKKILMSVYGISLLSFITIIFTARPIILFFYNEEYIESVNILYLLSFGMLLYGVADVFNRFLLAKGKGKELRNASYIVGIILIVSNFLLINSFGAIGASIAIIISGLSYLIVILRYYLKAIRQYA